jgi:hypothetical protein
MDRLVHGGHASHPPRGEVGHLIEQRTSELLERGIACTVGGNCRADRHGTRRRQRSCVGVGIEIERLVEVGRPVLVHDRVDLRPGRAETGPPQHAGGSQPPW